MPHVLFIIYSLITFAYSQQSAASEEWGNLPPGRFALMMSNSVSNDFATDEELQRMGAATYGAPPLHRLPGRQNQFAGIECDEYPHFIYFSYKEPATSRTSLSLGISKDDCKDLTRELGSSDYPSDPFEVEIIKKTKHAPKKGLLGLFGAQEEIVSYELKMHYAGVTIYENNRYTPSWKQASKTSTLGRGLAALIELDQSFGFVAHAFCQDT